MLNKNILISGAGIAGLTLAFWLKKYGFNPTVIEQSPRLREGGYMIDFFGAGFDVAEKMGIITDIEAAHIEIPEITFVNKNNRKVGGLNALHIRQLMNNRAFNLLRSDLSKVIYDHIRIGTEILFGTSICKIEEALNEVKVTFISGEVRSFDLIIGADGLHSNVRSLIFGTELQFEKFYGYYTSSFTIENYLRKKDSFLSYSIPGKQAAIYPLDENKLAAFFIFSSKEKLSFHAHDLEAEKQILRDEFGKLGWECPALLERMDSATDFYFDVVSQIQMNEWSKGRISLVGDACDCPSLLSGQGATLAMVGAYILAGELKEVNGNYKMAFQQYEKRFKPFIDKKQKIAQSFAGSFVPKSNIALWVRNTFTSLMFLPVLSKWLVQQYMTDKIILKDY